MTQTNKSGGPRPDEGSVPGELAAALGSHPWWIAGALVAAWLVALALSLRTPTQYEGEITIHVGEVGTVEAVRTGSATRWRTERVPLEDVGELGTRLFDASAQPSTRGFRAGATAGVYGVRTEEIGRRALRVIVRGASVEAARSLLGSIAADVLADHARRLDEVRAVQRTMRESLSARIREIRDLLAAAPSAAADRSRLVEHLVQLTAMELQLAQAGAPPLTRPTTVPDPPSVMPEPVVPRTARNLAVASVAGLFLGFGIALFLRAVRRTAS